MTKRVVTRNNHTFKIENSPITQDYDFWTVFENRTWEPELDDVLNRFLRPNNSLIDIGAWIGPITLMAAPLCRHVYAIEPDPVAAANLRANLKASDAINVTVHQCAIGPSNNSITLGPTAQGTLGDSMTTIWTTSDAAITVPAWTLETIVTANEITDAGLIKIDVEGAEQQFLPQAAPALHRIGAPVLLSLHTMLAPDPTRYLQTINHALREFDTTLIAGTTDALGVLLAIPRFN